jgi:hypothetical protein
MAAARGLHRRVAADGPADGGGPGAAVGSCRGLGGGAMEPVIEAGFDHEQLAVFVWRADRAGGDTKTPQSRRTLALPRRCAEACP